MEACGYTALYPTPHHRTSAAPNTVAKRSVLTSIQTVSVSGITWATILRPPWNVIFSRWTWVSVRYLLGGAALGLLWLLVVLLLFSTGVLLAPVGIGIVLLMLLVGLGPQSVAHDRARLGMETRTSPSWKWSRPWEAMGEWDTWRQFLYLLLIAFVVWPVEAILSLGLLLFIGTLLATPLLILVFGDQLVVGGPPLQSLAIWPFLPLFGVLLLVPSGYLWITAASARAALVRAVSTSRRAELDAQVVELGRSRVRLLDAFEVERKRIERDLHDGAQQRLVSLAMTLGLAQVELEGDGDRETASRLVADAQRDAGQALTELRELVRGIHPQVLTDRGLAAALDELAGRSAMTVRVDIDLPERAPALIESTVYFVVSEALSNAAKHGDADRIEITGSRVRDTLVVTVKDNGRGGADPARGTGLQGLVDRVAATGGRLLLASPVGGPTELRMEIPWTASAPR